MYYEYILESERTQQVRLKQPGTHRMQLLKEPQRYDNTVYY